MSLPRIGIVVAAGLVVALAVLLPVLGKADDPAAAWRKKGVWVSASDPSIPIDFKYQGEYVSTKGDSEKLGVQVIALDKGYFQAVVYAGGLPGAGWDGKNRSLLDGKLSDGKVSFEPAKKGKGRRYKGRKPEEFSATEKFPPVGQKDYTATSDGETLTLKGDGKTVELKKTARQGPTLGKEAPKTALLLFDGTDTKEWTGGRIDKVTKWLNTDGHDIRTKRKFNNYTVHLEFMTPFRPAGRDQERGNSGFYQVDRYEVQILDSFGLEGKNNECGGIYSRADSKVNMCLPPLTWQTYDIDFTNAIMEGDKKVKDARITVRLNGVVIHDQVDIKGNTEDHGNKNEGKPGALRLQGHGNPLQFRNIWIIEKK
jgi:hypothetical protein